MFTIPWKFPLHKSFFHEQQLMHNRLVIVAAQFLRCYIPLFLKAVNSRQMFPLKGLACLVNKPNYIHGTLVPNSCCSCMLRKNGSLRQRSALYVNIKPSHKVRFPTKVKYDALIKASIQRRLKRDSERHFRTPREVVNVWSFVPELLQFSAVTNIIAFTASIILIATDANFWQLIAVVISVQQKYMAQVSYHTCLTL